MEYLFQRTPLTLHHAHYALFTGQGTLQLLGRACLVETPRRLRPFIRQRRLRRPAGQLRGRRTGSGLTERRLPSQHIPRRAAIRFIPFMVESCGRMGWAMKKLMTWETLRRRVPTSLRVQCCTERCRCSLLHCRRATRRFNAGPDWCFLGSRTSDVTCTGYIPVFPDY